MCACFAQLYNEFILFWQLVLVAKFVSWPAWRRAGGAQVVLKALLVRQLSIRAVRVRHNSQMWVRTTKQWPEICSDRAEGKSSCDHILIAAA